MLICSFSLSPAIQFISNQRPFASFRAYRRSFKCNLVFGGFSYLPAGWQGNHGGICNSIFICICSNTIYIWQLVFYWCLSCECIRPRARRSWWYFLFGELPNKPQKYKNTEMQKYKNTKIQKYRNTKIQILVTRVDTEGNKVETNIETKIQKYKNTKIQKYTNTMKNIDVLRDTARAPKPISQKHAIPCNGVIRYHKIPYHT